MGLFDAGTKVDLRVTGMTCGHCQGRVEGALRAVPGVKKAQVDLQKGLATVTYDPAKASPEDLQQAVRGAGYEATPA